MQCNVIGECDGANDRGNTMYIEEQSRRIQRAMVRFITTRNRNHDPSHHDEEPMMRQPRRNQPRINRHMTRFRSTRNRTHEDEPNSHH